MCVATDSNAVITPAAGTHPLHHLLPRYRRCLQLLQPVPQRGKLSCQLLLLARCCRLQLTDSLIQLVQAWRRCSGLLVLVRLAAAVCRSLQRSQPAGPARSVSAAAAMTAAGTAPVAQRMPQEHSSR